uniref:Reverse transcriptase domain-containing protein n=1 Tax=Tanacetum cinerariifolium TaxID=118510 RepID=A0A6L2K332_TANCI|nr:reverse transcriptase domain-containing protein [Tanacetum cinerariifolium]
MSTRPSARNLFSPLDNLELTIRRRPRVDPTLVNDFNMATNRNGDDVPPSEGGDLPVPDLRTMEELCQPTLNGRALKVEMAEINKNLMKVLQINQQVKAVTHSCETCGGPHSYKDCPATVGQTQNVYAAVAYNQGGEQPRKKPIIQGANHGQKPHLAYQAPGYQARVQQALISQPQVVTTTEFTNYMKANDAILKNMQTNMTSLTNSNFELKNMFGQFMKMNTASSSGLGTLPSNTITNLKEDLKVVALVDEPAEASVSAPKPNTKPSILYPSRLHDQKLWDKANDQKEKFFQIFQDLNFNISFKDALILMPKFGVTIKSLLTNKEKLFKLARTPVDEHCSTVLLKKLPEKLGDPDKFLILCDFLGMDECLALSDLGTCINLMPLSMWNKLPLPELSPTYMTLELANRSISHPIREILLKTGHALIDVYEGELTLLVGNKAITFNLNQTSRYLANYDAMSVNQIDSLERNILLLEEFLNDDPLSPPLPPQELKVVEPKNKKSSIDEPPVVELKDLAPHLEYAFLEEFYTHKTLMEDDFKPSVQQQRRVNPKIHEVIKKEVLKLLDVRLVYPISDSPWEKSHFMVKEGIVLVHKILKNAIEVDNVKVDVVAKLPHPTTVKAKALPTNDARVFCKFLKSLFARFGTPRAIISDHGTHSCNDKFAKVMLKYGVYHHLATAYHPQNSRQMKVSNRGLKRILERTVGENRASWSNKFDDAL